MAEIDDPRPCRVVSAPIKQARSWSGPRGFPRAPRSWDQYGLHMLWKRTYLLAMSRCAIAVRLWGMALRAARYLWRAWQRWHLFWTDNQETTISTWLQTSVFDHEAGGGGKSPHLPRSFAIAKNPESLVNRHCFWKFGNRFEIYYDLFHCNNWVTRFYSDRIDLSGGSTSRHFTSFALLILSAMNKFQGTDCMMACNDTSEVFLGQMLLIGSARHRLWRTHTWRQERMRAPHNVS